jgi:hypothetical protein
MISALVLVLLNPRPDIKGMCFIPLSRRQSIFPVETGGRGTDVAGPIWIAHCGNLHACPAFLLSDPVRLPLERRQQKVV